MLMSKLLGASAAVEPTYIEDVFSTHLYTGNGTSQSINNGINLDTVNTTVGYSSLLQNHFTSGTREYTSGKVLEDASGNYYAIIKFSAGTGTDFSYLVKYSSADREVWKVRLSDSSSPKRVSFNDITFNSAGNVVITFTNEAEDERQNINVIDKDTGAILASAPNTTTSTSSINIHASGGNLYWAGRNNGNTVFINSDTAPGTEVNAYRVLVSTSAQKIALIPQSDGQPILVSAISSQSGGLETNGWVFTKLASNLQSQVWSTRHSHGDGSSVSLNTRYMFPGTQHYDPTDNMLYILWAGITNVSGNTTYTNYVSKFNLSNGSHVVSRRFYFNAATNALIAARSITKFGNKIICVANGYDTTYKSVLLEFDTNLTSLSARTVVHNDLRDSVKIYGGATSTYYHNTLYNNYAEVRRINGLTLTEPVMGVTPVSGTVTVTSASLTNTTTGYINLNVTFGAATDLMNSSGTQLSLSTQSINYSRTVIPKVDVPSEGGLVWLKARSAANSHAIYDTLRGNTLRLNTNTSGAAQDTTTSLSSFNSNGFSLSGSNNQSNESPTTYASWTFRKAPRFFDVVTYTGNGGTARAISHDLGVTPGMVIVKRTNAAQSWHCLHKDANLMFLDTTDAAFSAATTATRFGDGTNVIRPNSTTFTVTGSTINNSGDTYVAYLFAHDPLGPSGDGSDGLIACGVYVGNGSSNGPEITLGWEPQWVLTKRTDLGADWEIKDTMRGMSSAYNRLWPNLSTAEDYESDGITPTARGFKLTGVQPTHNASGGTYIYIAIRRGPMREPISGGDVFGINARTGTGADAVVTGGLTADAVLVKNRGAVVDSLFSSRMTGTGYLVTSTLAAEVAANTSILQANPWDVMDGVKVGTTSTITNASSNTFINYLFRRAPGVFDVVAYRGTGSTGTKNHSLGVVPEMMIFKNRNDTDSWVVYHQATGNTGYTPLNTTSGFLPAPLAFNNTSPTASVFTVGSSLNFSSSFNYIAYLFASLPGTSKVGSYTGNGSSQTINCAFTTGARFILIKRTDTTGDWYVWDTARGIVAGNDPRLSLNTSAAEVTTDDTIDPASSGFIVNQVAATNVNVNAASYIYLAIA